MKKLLLTCLALVVVISGAQLSWAADAGKVGDVMGGKAAIDKNAAGMKESAAAVKENAAQMGDVAIDGFCAVCLAGGKMVKGVAEHSYVYEGKTYYFPTEEIKQEFISNPASYLENLESRFMEMKSSMSEGMKDMKESSHGMKEAAHEMMENAHDMGTVGQGMKGSY